jgi:hypothetical protein
MPRLKTVEKMSVTLPRELATEVRALVRHGEMSAFFAESVQRNLQYRRQKSAMEKGFGAWRPENHPELNTVEDTVAYVCTMRHTDRDRLGDV